MHRQTCRVRQSSAQTLPNPTRKRKYNPAPNLHPSLPPSPKNLSTCAQLFYSGNPAEPGEPSARGGNGAERQYPASIKPSRVYGRDRFQPGDMAMINGQLKKVTKVYPNGSFDTEQ